MYEMIAPILEQNPNNEWLTVGDGRYGKDAKYIIENGSNAIASDISEYLLKEAKEIGYINEYQICNAESLSFKDSRFDYIFCKEAYHHFPRPVIALHEMLRVAKNAVIIIEPNDTYITDKISNIFFRKLKTLIKALIRKQKATKHSFEDVGNYLYTISRREVEKLALGLNYNTVAFKGINDVHFVGAEFEKLSEKGPIQRKIKLLISIADILCKLKLMDYGIIACIFF